jgi:hypothetical protein
MSRGRSVGFYLNYDYNINPAEAQAKTLVPQVRRIILSTPTEKKNADNHVAKRSRRPSLRRLQIPQARPRTPLDGRRLRLVQRPNTRVLR